MFLWRKHPDENNLWRQLFSMKALGANTVPYLWREGVYSSPPGHTVWAQEVMSFFSEKSENLYPVRCGADEAAQKPKFWVLTCLWIFGILKMEVKFW